MAPRRRPEPPADLAAALGPLPETHARPEVVLLRVRRHGRRLLLPVVALLAVAAAAGYWVGALPEPWMNLLAGVGAAASALLLGVFPVLAWLAHRTTVTSRRVILRHGFFVRHRSEVPLARLREVRLRRGPLQRLVGAGDIDLFSGADRVRLDDVPAAERVADALQELMERAYERGPAFPSPADAHSGVPQSSVPHPGASHADGDPDATTRFW